MLFVQEVSQSAIDRAFLLRIKNSCLNLPQSINLVIHALNDFESSYIRLLLFVFPLNLEAKLLLR